MRYRSKMIRIVEAIAKFHLGTNSPSPRRIWIFRKSPKAHKVMSICEKPNRLCDHLICASKRILQLPRVFWLVPFFLFVSCSTHKTTTAVKPLEERQFKYRAPEKPRVGHKTKKEAPLLVVIDPGHGAFDLGAHSPRYEEKAIALKAALFLRKHLEKAGYRVIMTRDRDEYITPKKRADIANQVKCQLLVSIHCNSAKNSQAKGIEIFYMKKTEPWRAKKSKELAQTVLSQLLAQTGATSRGIKEGNFCVIRETKMPSILVETGFLTNEEEQKKLKNDLYLDTIAKSIADGITQYFGACSQVSS